MNARRRKSHVGEEARAVLMMPIWLIGAVMLIVVAASAALAVAVWLGVYKPHPPRAHHQPHAVAVSPTIPPAATWVPMPAWVTPTSGVPIEVSTSTWQPESVQEATERPPQNEKQSIPAPPPAAAFPQGPGQLVIILDDMGVLPELSRQALATMPAPVAMSFLVYGEATANLAPLAKAKGHPILLHLPMEPQAHGAQGEPDMGPYGLKVGMSSATIIANIEANLAPLRGLAEGVNNHMGSQFTQWGPGMQVAMARIAQEGLYFIDSKTAAPTATRAAVKGLPMRWATRDVFLDHDPSPQAIRGELHRAVVMAQQRAKSGRTTPVIAIGHPLASTLAVLAAELPAVQAAGITLVTPSAALVPAP
jgi:polysaccharide deacetylase 2 family uncharacterized protein YibQ